MSKNRDILVVVVFSILITGLFYKEALGLNLLISETILLIWLLISKQYHIKGLYPITLGLGLILTSMFTVLTHSVFSYFLNFIVLFIFIGVLIYPDTKSILNALGHAFSNVFNSQEIFFRGLSGSRLKGKKLGSYIWKIRTFIIPILIIILFIFIYRKSNPVFDELAINIGLFFQEKFGCIFKDVDFLIVITFILSLICSVFIFIRSSNQRLIEIDSSSHEDLIRKRKKNRKNFCFKALINEYKAGVFLLIILNLVILVLNIIDIKWAWFGFEWEGQYLKQFVHEGTCLLIFSIIISIVLVLYYFRGNLNFYQNNKFLKFLSYLWIVQNGILAISVAIRNFWYINYFALAYKRIGVIIFLIITIYGLYTVCVKVIQRKSAFYLFKTNSYAILIVLIFSSLVNWDTVIAKYNFNNSEESFLHLDYLSTLSDKSLPYLDKSLSELKYIDSIQKEKFPFKQKFMTPEEYNRIISIRKEIFIKEWESKSFRSWNLPEYIAYKKLNF